MATPVFVFGEGLDTVTIVAGIGSCEGLPQEVVEVTSGKLRIVAEDNQREAIEILVLQRITQHLNLTACLFMGFEFGCLQYENTGTCHP